MLEIRLYRAFLALALAGFVVVMFSLVSRPEPLPLEISPEPFDGTAAAAATHRLLEAAPERAPGSDGDAAAAAFMREQFDALEGGTTVTDTFEAGYQRRRVELENVIYTLTGEIDDLVVVTAPRDCAEGVCAASSAAASGALIELARAMSRTLHRKTMVFVSTDGSAAGAAGAKRLAEYLAGRPVTGVIVLSQPGVREPHGRHVVPWSTSTRATAVQLVQTAEDAVERELIDAQGPHRGTGSELVRLAIPAGLGEQAPMIAAGLDAIALAGAGERPLSAAEDEEFSAATLAAFGRIAQSLLSALNDAPESLVAGPRARIPLSGKLVPGWALWLLSLTLLLPLAAAALESCARVRRRRQPLRKALVWALARCLPFLAALALAYLLALVRLIPAPSFPFDPALFPLDAKALIAAAILLLGLFAAQREVEKRLPLPESPEAGFAAIGLAIFIAGLVTWLVNPFLALVLLPSLHLILFAAGPRGGRAVRLGLLAGALLIAVIVIQALGRQLGVGFFEACWQLLLMFTGDHFGPLAALPAILVAGCLAAALQGVLAGWTNMRPAALRVQGPRRRYRGHSE